jgi:hypothetical protein
LGKALGSGLRYGVKEQGILLYMSGSFDTNAGMAERNDLEPGGLPQVEMSMLLLGGMYVKPAVSCEFCC